MIAGSTASADKACKAIKHVMDKMRAAVDRREKELVDEVKKQCEAKLKVIELHKGHVKMLDECAKTLAKMCGELLAQDMPPEAASKQDKAVKVREGGNARETVCVCVCGIITFHTTTTHDDSNDAYHIIPYSMAHKTKHKWAVRDIWCERVWFNVLYCACCV
jgi:hypothetical protein